MICLYNIFVEFNFLKVTIENLVHCSLQIGTNLLDMRKNMP